jgi:hypothetical protein
MLPHCGLFDICIFVFFPFIFIYWNFSCLRNFGIRDEHDVLIWCFITKVPGAYLSNLSVLNTMGCIIVWDFWSSEWHCDGISFDYAVLLCQYYSAGVSYSFIPLPSELSVTKMIIFVTDSVVHQTPPSLSALSYKLNWRGIVMWSSVRRR